MGTKDCGGGGSTTHTCDRGRGLFVRTCMRMPTSTSERSARRSKSAASALRASCCSTCGQRRVLPALCAGVDGCPHTHTHTCGGRGVQAPAPLSAGGKGCVHRQSADLALAPRLGASRNVRRTSSAALRSQIQAGAARRGGLASSSLPVVSAAFALRDTAASRSLRRERPSSSRDRSSARMASPCVCVRVCVCVCVCVCTFAFPSFAHHAILPHHLQRLQA